MSAHYARAQSPYPSGAIAARPLSQNITNLVQRFLVHLDVARQRRHLAQLDARLLDDIGVSRIDARREVGRDFWDIPEHLTR